MSERLDRADAEGSEPRCILPGCRNRADEQGMPCAQCAADFGDHLRQTDRPAMTAEAQAERDAQTHAAYAVLLAGGDPARVAAVSGHPMVRDGKVGPERKANQRCWMCEQRRTCTRQAAGWECDVCLQIT
ncbi:hypothetical protein [Mycobacterium sp. JS623]|uniref:hypothetical protein n=2 Tax=Mycobacterium TaxID=1763 RepID=UPI000687A07B|nr:hypothetical protein [Mycobacterium sp. JS623]